MKEISLSFLFNHLEGEEHLEPGFDVQDVEAKNVDDLVGDVDEALDSLGLSCLLEDSNSCTCVCLISF